jgi:hypothetical protein
MRAIIWDVTPCSLVDIDRRFREAYSLHHQPDHFPDSATVNSSETSVSIYQTTRLNVPKDSRLFSCVFYTIITGSCDILSSLTSRNFGTVVEFQHLAEKYWPKSKHFGNCVAEWLKLRIGCFPVGLGLPNINQAHFKGRIACGVLFLSSL